MHRFVVLEGTERLVCSDSSFYLGISLRKTSDAVKGQLTERKAGRPLLIMKADHTSWAPGPTDRLRAMETKTKREPVPKKRGREISR